jgi:DNA-binding CsgD family transcriptional regulator
LGRRWADSRNTLAEVATAIRSDDCRAVFIVADAGLGATHLLSQLDHELSSDMVIMPVHGSPSLSGIPYGVLAPYLESMSVEDVTSPVAVLRTLWGATESRRKAADGPALLVVDDAHALDDATAAIVTELVQAGWAKLIAASKPRPGIPGPMLQLWHDGAAERFDLSPLSQRQGHELCAALLGGTVLASTSQTLWAEAGGNPLLLKTLVSEEKRAGSLAQRHGIWLLTSPPALRSPELAHVVQLQLLRISPAGRSGLSLIALSEPVGRPMIEELAGREAVQELLDHQLISSSSADGAADLRLQNPIYGEVLRSLVPAGRSLQLRQELVSRLEVQPENPESLLRMTMWSLDCGIPIPDEQLLRAADLACKLFQSSMALRIVSAVNEPAHRAAANVIAARAHYASGEFEQAAALLDLNLEDGSELSELLTGNLLWVSAKAGLGCDPADVSQYIQRVRSAGERLAMQRPADAERIRASIQERCFLLELMALSLRGDYLQMEQTLSALLESQQNGQLLDSGLTGPFALAMRAEQLCALGHPDKGLVAALEAITSLSPGAQDAFFLPEFVLVRVLANTLFTADWANAERRLDRYGESSSLGLVSFGGGSQLVMGFLALRQGRMGEALEILLPSLEALRVSDPQQLFPLSAAMAFFAAAQQGLEHDAERLFTDYQSAQPVGPFLVAATTESYINAGLETLRRDGSGIGRLQRSADDFGKRGLRSLRLQALELSITLGDRSRLEEFCEVAESVAGPWAEALSGYGLALKGQDASQNLKAGEALYAVQLFPQAATVFGIAQEASEREGDMNSAARASEGLQKCYRSLGTPGPKEAQPVKPRELTQRERDVLALAAAGRTDREIAQQLHLSVRTVEGHLYRCYAKLGIAGRDELDDVAIG